MLFVQSSVDLDDPQRGHWLFECMGGPAEQNSALYSFVLVHGMEASQGHQLLKH